MKLETRQFLLHAHECTLHFWKCFRLPWCKFWPDSSPDGRKLAGKLMQEEFNELIAAPNKLEELDAYCDLLYVTTGAMHALGYNSQLYPLSPPAQAFAGPLAESIKLIAEPGVVCHRRLQSSIPDACWGIVEAGRALTQQFDAAFDCVHAANMSKLWKNKSPDPEHYSESIALNTWLVKRKSDGKVVKSPEFKHPDLTRYLA